MAQINARLIQPGGTVYPAFRPRAPWWGGDLQTLRNYLTGAHLGGDRTRPAHVAVATDDGTGDRLLGLLDRPPVPADKPLAVLVHGLTGCDGSAYMRRSAYYLRNNGFPVLRLNLRGAGPTRSSSKRFYYAGCSEDLHALVAGLPPELQCAGVVLIGFSLGGNVVLKYLAEIARADGSPVIAAASVSAPIDLTQAAETLLRRRNRLYHRWLLDRTKADCRAAPDRLTDPERKAVAAASTLPAFDDVFTAPRNGFADAEDYYAGCSARQWLSDIATPTLIIHATNDPWIPPQPYQSFDWRTNTQLTPLLGARGGHVGFHGQGSRVAWHDRCIVRYLDRLTVKPTGVG